MYYFFFAGGPEHWSVYLCITYHYYTHTHTLQIESHFIQHAALQNHMHSNLIKNLNLGILLHNI